MNVPKPVVLIVLDGWGLAPSGPGNAVSQAKTPHFDYLWQEYPHTRLKAYGRALGLPRGEMGSSESGHLTIGAGRIIYQDNHRIDQAIRQGSFFQNKALVKACQIAKNRKRRLHLLGLFSQASVHADKKHLFALLRLARQQKLKGDQVQIHLFTDGRDSPPRSALSLLTKLKKEIKKNQIGEISTVTGRYYAMDRDRRWQRTKKAFAALALGQGVKAETPEKAIKNSYQQNVSDEFILPTVINQKSIAANDALIFFNFRTDRARQLTRAFVQRKFPSFKREKVPQNLFFVSMTEFEKDLAVQAVAFPPLSINQTLPQVIAHKGLRQLHLAETEKYAFVTYYFNGLKETKEKGEDQILIPSPKVSTYDLKPEMSAEKITKTVLRKITAGIYDFILINFANPDMVGHTGVLKAGIKACEAVDRCLGKISQKVFAKNGACLITADHGNVEEMIDPQTQSVSTRHSLNPIPLIIVGQKWENKKLNLTGAAVIDIAPTILALLAIKKPKEMTGQTLI